MSDIKYIFLVLVIAILGPFASDSYLPSLPQMTEYFQTTETVMQLTVTVFFLGLASFQLLWGPFSDKLGRRKALLLGGLTALVGCVVAMFAWSPTMLNIGRFIQGAGGAANATLCRSVLRDRFSGPRLAQAGGIVGIFFALVPSVAPIVGGFIQEAFDWRANFIFLFFFTLTIVWIIWQFFPESNNNLNHRALHWDQFMGNYKTLLTDKSFLGYTLASSAGFSGLIAYYTISPFLLQNVLLLTPSEYGYSAIVITLGFMAGHLTNAMLVKKLGMNRMLELGFFTMLVGGVLMTIYALMGIVTLTAILAPTLIFIYGSSFTFSNGAAGAIQRFGHIAGSAGAMFGFLQILGTTIISFLISFSSDETGLTLGITFTLMALFAFGLYNVLVTKAQEF